MTASPTPHSIARRTVTADKVRHSGEVVQQTARVFTSAEARVVTVHATGEHKLSLTEFVGQVARQAPSHVVTHDRLENAFATLTQPGPGFSRVVLVVTGAELLGREAFEYLRLT